MSSQESKEIKIGALATLVGPFEVMGTDGMRGIKMAIAEFGGSVCGKNITLVEEGTNAIPDAAAFAAQKLIEQDRVDFIVGPLSGNEGLAVKDYAKTRLDKTFLNGTAGAQEITLYDPAPNFFNFSANGVQWTAGLGRYAYNIQGFRRVVTIAEDYSYPYSQVGGFVIDFHRAGGKVLDRFWVPLGTVDFRPVIEGIPKDVDAVFVALAGTDAINFLQGYEQIGRSTPLIGGTSTVDQTILSTKGKLSERVVGMASAGPIADNNPDPAWQRFVAAYKSQFSRGLASPSLCAHGYYVNAKAALLALQSINGEFSENQENFENMLSSLAFETPTGPVKLDHNRQAIANIFINIVDRQSDGKLYNRLVSTTHAVNQTLGIPEAEYLTYGPLGRDKPKFV